MARSIATIQAEMDAQQALQTGLSGLNSPSQAAIYTLWKYIMSVSIFTMETLWDLFRVELEEISGATPTGTVAWVQRQVLLFQFSLATPQVVQLIDFVPSYIIVDEALQIITRASVKTLPNKTVSVKVAKSEPPVQLSVAEINSLVSYLEDIGHAGVQFSTTSLVSDKLFLEAEIFFEGQYSSTISATVISAIETFLSEIPFDGSVRVMSLIDAVQAVEGVTDIIITGMAMRADVTVFSSKTFLVENKTTIFNKLDTFAGYIVQETTGGETLTDKLTFTPES